MKQLTFHPSPLAAWLILVGSLVTLFPLKLEQIEIILITATLLSLAWLPKKRTRSIPLLLAYVALAALALAFPLPLPTTWHPLTRLLVVLLIWTALLYLPLSALLYYLFRTASSPQPHQHTGQ